MTGKEGVNNLPLNRENTLNLNEGITRELGPEGAVTEPI